MKKLLFLLMSVFAGACVAEASTGFFFTAATGQSRINAKYTSLYTDATRETAVGAELNSHTLYWSVGLGFSLTDLLRVTAGYEDWGKSTAPAGTGADQIYPLTVGDRGYYVSYAPMIKVFPRVSIDPEIGLLYSNIDISTDFGRSNGFVDTNVRLGHSTLPRYGIGISVHLPGTFVVGVKYLQIELPGAGPRFGSAFFTEKIRARTLVLSAQCSF
jgi:hypothetical protein